MMVQSTPRILPTATKGICSKTWAASVRASSSCTMHTSSSLVIQYIHISANCNQVCDAYHSMYCTRQEEPHATKVFCRLAISSTCSACSLSIAYAFESTSIHTNTGSKNRVRT